jgi:putative SOS response-associated peptidase YedK
MCGRFFQSSPSNRVIDQFVIREFFEDEAGPTLRPRYNIAPSQPVPVIHTSQDTGRRRLEAMQWGLVPSWSKDPSSGPRPINARSEDAAGKPFFRNAMRKRRCLILADGFYEWKKNPDNPKARKQPFAIQLADKQPFGMAGLWEYWDGHGGPLLTCTIMTTTPNELMADIHDRMPVILSPEDHDRWLDPKLEKADDVADLLRPYPAEQMHAYAISTRVNSPANDDERCLEPADTGLFGE